MDKSLPPSLAKSYEDFELYNELTQAERKLDWTVARKRAELQDSLSRSHTVIAPGKILPCILIQSMSDAQGPSGLHLAYMQRAKLANHTK